MVLFATQKGDTCPASPSASKPFPEVLRCSHHERCQKTALSRSDYLSPSQKCEDGDHEENDRDVDGDAVQCGLNAAPRAERAAVAAAAAQETTEISTLRLEEYQN